MPSTVQYSSIVTNIVKVCLSYLTQCASFTCGKCQEGIGFCKSTVFPEEVGGVKVIWPFPLAAFEEHRGEVGDDQRALERERE